VGQLKRELARLKAEDQMVIESLHNRVRELEMEVNELQQIAETTTHVWFISVILVNILLNNFRFIVFCVISYG
jgi:hypothetical protein